MRLAGHTALVPSYECITGYVIRDGAQQFTGMSIPHDTPRILTFCRSINSGIECRKNRSGL